MDEERHAPTLDYATPGPRRARNVAAIISLVSGLALLTSCLISIAASPGDPPYFAFLFGVISIVSGLFGVLRARRRGAGMAFSVFGLIIGTLCVTVFILPERPSSHPTANRAKCMINLRQLGQGILLYSNDSKGRYPGRWEDVLLTQDIGPELFCCPSSDEKKAPGTTPQQQAANLSKTTPNGTKHLSYVYVGQGFTAATVTPQAILAYEPLANHDGDGMNILFGDGHVEFIGKADAQVLLNELTTDHNPPRPTQFAAGQR